MLCASEGLVNVDFDGADLEEIADRVLLASYRAGIDVYSVDDLILTLEQSVLGMNEKYPNNRVRLKAIGGGGGLAGDHVAEGIF